MCTFDEDVEKGGGAVVAIHGTLTFWFLYVRAVHVCVCRCLFFVCVHVVCASAA